MAVKRFPVIILVSGGVAEVTSVPEGVEVRIVDEDAGITDIFGPGPVLKERKQHHAN